MQQSKVHRDAYDLILPVRHRASYFLFLLQKALFWAWVLPQCDTHQDPGEPIKDSVRQAESYAWLLLRFQFDYHYAQLRNADMRCDFKVMLWEETTAVHEDEIPSSLTPFMENTYT